MVKKIVTGGLGGKIWFDSEEGKGTAFYVSIPIAGMKEKIGTTKLANT
jgi:signal transduction histidine kinase